MSGRFGLSEADLALVVAVLRKHPEVHEARIFGSRAKGSQKPGSDVDLALGGPNLTPDVILAISAELNQESPLPYHFDILNFAAIANKDLVEHIERVGVGIFPLP